MTTVGDVVIVDDAVDNGEEHNRDENDESQNAEPDGENPIGAIFLPGVTR